MLAPVTDLILLAILAAFFGLAVLLVKACERIVGASPEAERLNTEQDDSGQLAA